MPNAAKLERVSEQVQVAETLAPIATPFVKWVGGKRAILPALSTHLPDKIGTYWEPFVGGGAVFFSIAHRIDRAILSDTNEELIITYNTVKTQVENLIDHLYSHAKKHKEDDYYLKVREQRPTSSVEIAARLIYLNKTCYNGLYRVNKSGKFNVPKGRYENPTICDDERLRAASFALSKSSIKLGDFQKIAYLSHDDFIYCDPPYDDCFTNYQADGFSSEDQERLKNAVDNWMRQGAKVMVSNSKTPLIQRLYRSNQYKIHTVEAPRNINSKASERGNVPEIIITSYG